MNTLLKSFTITLIAFLFFAARCTPVEEEVLSNNISITLQHNYIAISATDESPCQVRLSYSIKEGTENKVITKIKTTPFVFGGEDVIASYNVVQIGEERNHRLVRNYTPKGADFLSIENLSDKDLEYAVIGNETLQYRSLKELSEYEIINPSQLQDSHKVIKVAPSPVYKKAPILYLLYPDKAPNTDCYVISSLYNGEKAKTIEKITLKAPNFGDILTNMPYSIQQILNIYRQEYTKGGVLYRNYNYSKDYSGAYKASLRETSSSELYYGSYKEAIHYGKISAHHTLTNKGKIWFLNNQAGIRGGDNLIGDY